MTRYKVNCVNHATDERWTVVITESCPQTAQEAALLLLFRNFGWSWSTASVPVEAE